MLSYSFPSLNSSYQLNDGDRILIIEYLQIYEKIQELVHYYKRYLKFFIIFCHWIPLTLNNNNNKKDSVQNMRVQMFFTETSMDPL